MVAAAVQYWQSVRQRAADVVRLLRLLPRGGRGLAIALEHAPYIDRWNRIFASSYGIAAMPWSVLAALVTVLSLAVTIGLLASVSPWLTLLALLGVPLLLATRRADRLLRAAAHGKEAAPATATAATSGPTVRFDNVVFAYPGSDRPILDGLSLTLHSGQTTAIVGENGVGKTTLVKLLAGLYRPSTPRALRVRSSWSPT